MKLEETKINNKYQITYTNDIIKQPFEIVAKIIRLNGKIKIQVAGCNKVITIKKANIKEIKDLDQIGYEPEKKLYNKSYPLENWK